MRNRFVPLFLTGLLTVAIWMSTPANEGAVWAGSSQNSGRMPPQAPIKVNLEVAPYLQGGKLYFTVTTNLPDGMLFMATITDDMGLINSVDATVERLHALTSDGRMQLGPFPIWGTCFPSGEYTLYLTSSPDFKQDKEVLEIIGKNGKNLTGPRVSRGTVVFVKSFMITGADRNRRAESPN